VNLGLCEKIKVICVPLERLSCTISGTHTTGWESLIYMHKMLWTLCLDCFINCSYYP